jgi:hypothetical protein
MLFTKLHLGVALFASAFYIIQIQPLVQQRTTFLFPKFHKNHYKKSMDDGKNYADFCIQCHQANGKGMALISDLRRIKLAYRKKNPKYSCVKV